MASGYTPGVPISRLPWRRPRQQTGCHWLCQCPLGPVTEKHWQSQWHPSARSRPWPPGPSPLTPDAEGVRHAPLHSRFTPAGRARWADLGDGGRRAAGEEILRPCGRRGPRRGHRAVVSRPERPVRLPRPRGRRDAQTLSLDGQESGGHGGALFRFHRELGHQARRHHPRQPAIGRLDERRRRPAVGEHAGRNDRVLSLHGRPGGHRHHDLDRRLPAGLLPDAGQSPLAQLHHQRR